MGRQGTVVIVGCNIIHTLGETLRKTFKTEKYVVVSSETVGRLYSKQICQSLSTAGLTCSLILIPDGEAGKTWKVVGEVLEKMSLYGMDRKSVVLALGGGAVGDAAGFAAACYMRGVSLVQVPTTLLAMVDSCLGGKTGVNLSTGKNLAGSFLQPQLVFVDVIFLNTLDKREIASGLAEVVKYGIISDKELFENLNTAKEFRWLELVSRCLRIKGEIVERDEFEEKDFRALLNFGHTIGHAIEAAAGYSVLTHGESISIGMNAEAWISTQLAGLPQSEHQKIVRTCQMLGLPVIWEGGTVDSVLEIMARDKKFHSGKMRFVLTDRIGHAFIYEDVSVDLARKAVELVITGKN